MKVDFIKRSLHLKIFVSFVIVFFLTQCQNGNSSIVSSSPTVSPSLISSTVTSTLTTIPTLTYTPQPTHTPTPLPIPIEGNISFRTATAFYLFDIEKNSLITFDDNLRSGDAYIWSPDGSKLSFIPYFRTSTEIYLQDKLSGQKTLIVSHERFSVSFNPNSGGDPYVWSPDSKKIAFTTTQDGNFEIYVIDIESGSVSNLTNNSAQDYAPAWSPDGKKIAFESDRDGSVQIYVMDSNGGQQKQITQLDSPNIITPTWSPDGNKIAFRYLEEWPLSEIYMMNPDGSDLVQLTQSGEYRTVEGIDITWSPDNSKIIFDAVLGWTYNIEVFVVDVNSREVTRLTFNEDSNEKNPIWSPNGDMIFYTSSQYGKDMNHIVLADVNGEMEPIILLSHPKLIHYITWLP